MTITIYDRVQETTTSTGTSNITLLGAVTGYQTFDSTVGVSNQTYYGIIDNIANIWEIGIGTLVDSVTISRDTVLDSTSDGSLITLVGNICNVFIDVPAAERIQVDSSITGANVSFPLVAGNSTNFLNNESSQTIIATDGSGNIQLNANGNKVLGVDGNNNPFLHNSTGHQTFGHDSADQPVIANANGTSVFSIDDDGNPTIKPVSGNAIVGFDGNQNPKLIATSGSGSVEFDGNNNPIIQNSSGVDVFAIDGGGHPYISPGNAPGAPNSTIGFDGNLNPYITNSSGDEIFSVDGDNGLPKINSATWPANDIGLLANDGSGNLNWQSPYRAINTQTNNYTLQSSDAGITIIMNSSSAITLTIPLNLFDTDVEIDIVQGGIGQLTLVADDGVTINSYIGNLSLAGQWAGSSIKQISTNNWFLVGNLA